MNFAEAIEKLKSSPQRWVVTGAAGFIGSNLLEFLLSHDQTVIGVDNFATGHQHNLDLVQTAVSEHQWAKFHFVEGDVSNLECCTELFTGAVDHVLHQAALGSVPRSIENPIATNLANVTGFLNMLWAAEQAGVDSFVYAASSSTYGDHPGLPKVEDTIGKPLSPYAVTKYINELYADVFGRCYRLKPIGLRYFNVFGPRQDPNGAYAAVIPKWTQAMINDEQVHIYGDGETSRDFCFVQNVVKANILSALADDEARGEVFNVAFGMQTSLTELFELIQNALEQRGIHYQQKPAYSDFRSGDVRHSLADISKAATLLGYVPEYDVQQGIALAMDWYTSNLQTDNLQDS